MAITNITRLEIIEELWAVIEDRKANPKEGSYTNKLLSNEKKLFEKLKEELLEVEDAAKRGQIHGSEKDSMVWEVSDLLYHLLVLLAAKGVSLDEVMTELKRRR